MQDRIDNGFNRSNIISSPYLNFDRSILNPSGGSQFIVPEGQGEHRGKMEYAFFTIGTAVTVGGLFGGVNGLLQGMKDSKGSVGRVRYTQLINAATKSGSMTSQSFGAMSLIFSLSDTLLSTVREVDDEFNTVASGVLTGLLYMAPRGLRAMAKGSAVGLGLTATYLLYQKKDVLAELTASKTI